MTLSLANTINSPLPYLPLKSSNSLKVIIHFWYYIWSPFFTYTRSMYLHFVITSLFSSFHCYWQGPPFPRGIQVALTHTRGSQKIMHACSPALLDYIVCNFISLSLTVTLLMLYQSYKLSYKLLLMPTKYSLVHIKSIKLWSSHRKGNVFITKVSTDSDHSPNMCLQNKTWPFSFISVSCPTKIWQAAHLQFLSKVTKFVSCCRVEKLMAHEIRSWSLMAWWKNANDWLTPLLKHEFVWLHRKQIHQLFFCCISAAQRVFAAPQNSGICSIKSHMRLPPVATRSEIFRIIKLKEQGGFEGCDFSFRG